MQKVLLGLVLSLTIGCAKDEQTEAPFDAPQGVQVDQSIPIGAVDAGMSILPDMSQPPTAVDAQVTPPSDLPPDPRINAGWIGGPCQSDADCSFDDGYCLTDAEGYPRGMCTQSCNGLCPDREGMPVTFCASEVVDDGVCVQRCDSTYFAATGCRPGYTCESRERYGEPPSNTGVCVPGMSEPEMMPPTNVNQTCLNTLTELGLQFTAAMSPDDSPSGRPDLTCSLNTPIYARSPIGGIDYVVHDRSESSPIFIVCYFARALLRLGELLTELNVVKVGHIGTYNCRVISGTDTLSEHGNANAIDLKWFETADGRRYDVEDHWEHGKTSNFATEEGAWLYRVAQEMHTRRIFNIILTPEFNAAHDNHFHVDMTPGAQFIESNGGGCYIGPNVHGD